MILQLRFYFSAGQHIFWVIRVLDLLAVAYPGNACHRALLVVYLGLFNKAILLSQLPKIFRDGSKMLALNVDIGGGGNGLRLIDRFGA